MQSILAHINHEYTINPCQKKKTREKKNGQMRFITYITSRSNRVRFSIILCQINVQFIHSKRTTNTPIAKSSFYVQFHFISHVRYLAIGNLCKLHAGR